MPVNVMHTGSTSFMVDAPDANTASILAAVCTLWRTEEAEQTTDLGDLTAYNAARAALRDQRDYWQEQINLLDSQNNPQPITERMELYKANRDVFSALMRATQRPE